MLKVVQVIQGCCWLSLMEEAIAKLPILEILPMLLAHLSVLILRPNPTHNPPMLPLITIIYAIEVVWFLNNETDTMMFEKEGEGKRKNVVVVVSGFEWNKKNF